MPSPWHRRGLPALFGVIVLAGIAAWLGRDPLLHKAADLWIVSDPVIPADVVAIFGGGLNDRPFAAAAYYREGLAKKILLSKNRAITWQRPTLAGPIVLLPLAARGLTAVFGMGTGGTPGIWSPGRETRLTSGN